MRWDFRKYMTLRHHAVLPAIGLDLQKCAADEQEDEEAFLEAMTNPAAASPANQLGIKVKFAGDEGWSDIFWLQPGHQSAGEKACWQETMLTQLVTHFEC